MDIQLKKEGKDTVLTIKPKNRKEENMLGFFRALFEGFCDKIDRSIQKQHSQSIEIKELKSKLFNHPKDIRLRDINFSVRTSNCLSGMGVETLQELSEKSESELLCSKNFGKKSLAEVRKVMDFYSFKFENERVF